MVRRRTGVHVRLAALAALAAMLAGSGAALSGQSAPAATAPRREAAAAQAGDVQGTARITGQVVAADTGAPVKRLAVSVLGGTPRPAAGAPGPTAIVAVGSPPSGMVRREVTTDEAGRFECGGLPAGRYSVAVRDTGMFVAPLPAAVDLAAGGSASLTIRLDRGGSITGRVLDDEGDPVVKASVVAGQRRSVGGAWRLMQTGSAARATTDDLGQFRLYGLPAGEFYVSAAYTVRTPAPGPDQPGAASGHGFAPTFHPSATGFERAQKVIVRLGQETAGIDVSLVRAKLGSVSGRVTDAAGNALAERQVSVMLVPPRDALAGPAGSGARWQADGTFVISNVPPGRYLVAANVVRQAPSPSQGEAGFEQVAVDGDDVVVHLQTNTGATVSGRVVIEGAKPAGGWAVADVTGRARASVLARMADAEFPAQYNGGRPVTVGEDLTFQLTGLRGALVLMALVPGTALKSVTRGASDVTAAGLTLKGTESIEDITITVTTDTGAIDGRVTTAAGDPAGAWIVVIPDDPSKRFPGSPFVRVARSRPSAVPDLDPSGAAAPGAVAGGSAVSRQAGGFWLPYLLPGRYAVAALPADDASPGAMGSMPPTDPESLSLLMKTATMTSVAAGETATLHLALRK